MTKASEPLNAQSWTAAFIVSEGLPAAYRRIIETVHAPLAARLARQWKIQSRGMFIVGISGAQGTGKSTLAASLAKLLSLQGVAVAALSIDDLYLTHAERLTLSERVHPLFETRGVPGTHDIALGMRVIEQLRTVGATSLPRFDKAKDDRCAAADWQAVEAPLDILLLEGWCVGAKPQTDAELSAPVNELESSEDPRSVWRHHVNRALATEYQRLFATLDMLIMLRAPDFEFVFSRRLEQERKLRQRVAAAGGDPRHLMSDAQLRRFISHFQRLTCHMLAEMPARADVVLDVAAID